MSQAGILGPASGGAIGDVTGPATSTDNAVARWDGATGKLLQNSVVIVDDTGNTSGVANLTMANGGAVRTTTTLGNTFLIQAYDNDTGPAYVTFVTLTAGNTPTCALSGVTIDNSVIGGVTPAAVTTTALSVTGGAGTGTIDFDGIASGSGFANSSERTRQAAVQTTDATATAIATITLSANEMLCVEARFCGFRDDFGASIGGTLVYTARRAGAGAVEVSVPVVVIQEDSAGAPIFDADVSGNDVRLLVQGIALENWNWVCTYRYHTTRTNA